MGNRAVITWQYMPDSIGVYVHWNGGLHSVTAFLEYCHLKGYRSPDRDNYGYARLCQVIGNFFGGSNSVGIDLNRNLDCDNGDNGVYVCKGWEIVGHVFDAPCIDRYDVAEVMKAINGCMPESEQVDDEEIEEWCKKRVEGKNHVNSNKGE